jgi:NADH:ubiquinone oxidoreductase subunit F (NADH-binding)
VLTRMLEGYIRDTRYVTVVTSLATANTQESLLFSAKSLATHSTEAPLKQPVWYIMTRLALGLRLSSLVKAWLALGMLMPLIVANTMEVILDFLPPHSLMALTVASTDVVMNVE